MTTKIMEAIVRVSDGGNEPEDVQLVKTLLSKAKEGDMQAMKLIFNYVDGMPPQSVDLTSKGEKLGSAAEIIAAIEASKKK